MVAQAEYKRDSEIEWLKHKTAIKQEVYEVNLRF